MHFEWDPKKATANRRKQGVTFEEATSALRDVFSATAHNPDHSDNEERFVTFGVSFQGRLLAVSHADRGEAIRIISARLATNAERQIYEEVKSAMTDELRPEYKRSDFGEIVRGKYAARIKKESNVVLLEPDIAATFPNDEAVNKALRYLLEVAKASTSPTRSSGEI